MVSTIAPVGISVQESRPPLDLRRVSVVVPVFNEELTLPLLLGRLASAVPQAEIIVVDDGSRDGTSDLLTGYAKLRQLVQCRLSANQGKGAAVRAGLALCTREFVVIQDADLEYDPAEIARLIEPLASGAADVVLGSRFLGKSSAWLSPWQRWANRLITGLANLLYGLRLTDIETCQKAMRREHVGRILPLLSENRFGIEIELIAKLSRIAGVRFQEVPVSYTARTRAEGKKITWRDGVRALWCLVRHF